MLNVDELVVQALSSSEELLGALANRKCSIYHDSIPDDNIQYPALMYTTIIESPVLHTDNHVYAFQKSVRVTIVNNTNAGMYHLKELVLNAMESNDFLWQSTNSLHDKLEHYLVLDFAYGALY